MAVKRIVPDFYSADPAGSKAFYQDVLGLTLVMDQGWINTFACETATSPQISIMSQGGNGAPVPDVSIEVDDVDTVYAKAASLGYEIIYELCDEEWGVRRFFVRDPSGKVLNILSHH